jgi:SAM-dependent MidA family methyltransferase
LWAAGLRRLVERVDAALGGAALTVVDLGAGGGELLTALAADAPPHWQLAGVDVCPRPPALPAYVEWRAELPSHFTGLLLAVEWLDVVPVDVATRVDGRVRLVEVDPHGRERAEQAVPADDAAWLDRWWPLPEDGDRAEIGRPRDETWSDAVSRLDRGIALAIDYAAVPARDLGGTLTGYRDGRQVLAVPDGSRDLTAHVLMESCAAAVECDESKVLTQRQALSALGVDGRRPAYDGDPGTYLAALNLAGQAGELLDPSGLGAFAWLMHAKGVPLAV